MITQYSHEKRRLNSTEKRSAPRRSEAPAETKETLTRIVLMALLLYAAFSLAAAGQALYEAENIERELRTALTAAQAENRQALEKNGQGWSAEEIEALARRRLGLVMPRDRIFLFPPPDETQAP